MIFSHSLQLFSFSDKPWFVVRVESDKRLWPEGPEADDGDGEADEADEADEVGAGPFLCCCWSSCCCCK